MIANLLWTLDPPSKLTSGWTVSQWCVRLRHRPTKPGLYLCVFGVSLAGGIVPIGAIGHGNWYYQYDINMSRRESCWKCWPRTEPSGAPRSIHILTSPTNIAALLKRAPSPAVFRFVPLVYCSQFVSCTSVTLLTRIRPMPTRLQGELSPNCI